MAVRPKHPARTRGPRFADCVFVNCPFDAEYWPIFEAIVFGILDCGFTPRSALEFRGSTAIASASSTTSTWPRGGCDSGPLARQEGFPYDRDYKGPAHLALGVRALAVGCS